jgi:HlyD family secretion protein
VNQMTSQQSLDEFLGVEPPKASARIKKWALIASAALLVLFVGWKIFGKSGSAKSYAAEDVVRGDLQVTVTATGNLEPTNEVTVGSELSGLVETVHVDVNDRVRKGQALAQIDTLRLRDTLSRSGAALDSAKAGVGQASATVQQSNSTLARLQKVYKLSDGKVPSLTELDAARADSARAIANLHTAQAQVTSAQAQLRSDNTNLQKATIRSPVTGVVLSRQIEPGQTVAASFNTPTLFTIAEDLSAMELEVKVDEADVGQVREGQTAKFSVDAWPGRSFPARIKRVDVGSNATTTTTSSNSTVIAYNAVLTVQNPDLILRPGMTATADILTSGEKNVLLVPNAALRFKIKDAEKKPSFGMMGPPRQRKDKIAKVGRGTRQEIYLLGNDGSPRKVSVVAGASNGSLTSISGNGIKAGDKVITSELAAAK